MSRPVPSGLDAAAEFAARALRFGPDALIRVRGDAEGGRLWTVLPFQVLACRTAPVPPGTDTTVRAADLRGADGGVRVDGLPRHDGGWRTALPAGDGRLLETVPGAELRRVDRAAAETLRARRGQGVGDRRLRDALLDHPAITVTVDDATYDVPLRLVVALFRMGLHDDTEPAHIRLAGRRLGIAGAYGSVWSLDTGLRVLM